MSSSVMSVSEMRTGTRCCIFTKLPAELSVDTIEYFEPVAELMASILPLNVSPAKASTVTVTSCPTAIRSICVSL